MTSISESSGLRILGPDPLAVTALRGLLEVPGSSPLSAVVCVIDARYGQCPRDLARLATDDCPRCSSTRRVIVVDAMDRVGCEYVVFEERRRELLAAGMQAHVVIPVVARLGENVSASSRMIEWYSGPTLLEWLRAHARAIGEHLEAPAGCCELDWAVAA